MPKFSDIADGDRARKNVQLDVGRDTPASIDVRVLRPDEEADVLAYALKFAKDRGVTDPRDGDALYDLGRWVRTAALACVDPESSKDDPKPFFDGGVEQILGSRRITREHLAFLYEHQEAWQDECSPYEKDVGASEMMVRTIAIAKGDTDPFVRMRPSTRFNFTRTLAARYLNSLAARSSSTPPSPEPS